MTWMDHWHPVLTSASLRRDPVGVRLCDRELVLFRGAEGAIGALDDCCPHRRMRLSKGTVVGGRLQCRYHGWSYTQDGAGESPGTPKLHCTAASFEAVERFGAVWVRPRGSSAAFPEFRVDGHYHVCTLQHHVSAPLEVVVDNFCEIEHTPTTHALFGYPLDRMHEVQVRFETTDRSVRVINSGPSKPLSGLFRFLLDIGKTAEFNDDWTTYFSPVYSVYDHWWFDPKTGRDSRIRWRLYIFFVPKSAAETTVVTFCFAKSRIKFGPAGGLKLFRGILVSNLRHEIDLDVELLNNLADKTPHIEGMKLSRFDRVLGLNRERIARIYHGREPAPGVVQAG